MDDATERRPALSTGAAAAGALLSVLTRSADFDNLQVVLSKSVWWPRAPYWTWPRLGAAQHRRRYRLRRRRRNAQWRGDKLYHGALSRSSLSSVRYYCRLLTSFRVANLGSFKVLEEKIVVVVYKFNKYNSFWDIHIRYFT